MEILSSFSLIVFCIYLGGIFFIRIKNVNKKHVLLFIFIFFILGMIHIINIYSFYDGKTISYGSDSSAFERLFISIQSTGLSNNDFNYLMFDQFKGLHIYLLSPIYQLIYNNLIAGLFVFFISFLTYLATIITVLKILVTQSINISRKPAALIYFNFISVIVVFSFLRDVYILFFLVEFYYVFYFFKNRIWKTIILLLISFSILFLRNFYLIFIIMFFLIVYINKEKIGEFKKKKYIRIIFILSILLIGFYFSSGYIYKGFGKLLMLQKADMESVGRESLVINVNQFYSGGYSLFSLVRDSLFQFSLGFYKFLIAPIFTSYFGLFNLKEPYYFGIDTKLYLIGAAAIYNFYILPALFASFMFIIKEFKKFLNNPPLLYFSLMYFASFIIYSIKFFGKRNMKIDFVNFVILIIIISLSRSNWKWKYFKFGLLFMIVLNVYVAYIKYL